MPATAKLTVRLPAVLPARVIVNSPGSFGSAAVASLADWVDLDGNLLLADEPFEGLVLGEDHRWQLSDRPGLGVSRRA